MLMMRSVQPWLGKTLCKAAEKTAKQLEDETKKATVFIEQETSKGAEILLVPPRRIAYSPEVSDEEKTDDDTSPDPSQT